MDIKDLSFQAACNRPQCSCFIERDPHDSKSQCNSKAIYKIDSKPLCKIHAGEIALKHLINNQNEE